MAAVLVNTAPVLRGISRDLRFLRFNSGFGASVMAFTRGATVKLIVHFSRWLFRTYGHLSATSEERAA